MYQRAVPKSAKAAEISVITLKRKSVCVSDYCFGSSAAHTHTHQIFHSFCGYPIWVKMLFHELKELLFISYRTEYGPAPPKSDALMPIAAMVVLSHAIILLAVIKTFIIYTHAKITLSLTYVHTNTQPQSYHYIHILLHTQQHTTQTHNTHAHTFTQAATHSAHVSIFRVANFSSSPFPNR